MGLAPLSNGVDAVNETKLVIEADRMVTVMMPRFAVAGVP